MLKALLGPFRKSKKNDKEPEMEEVYSVELSDMSGSSSMEGLNELDQGSTMDEKTDSFHSPSTLNSSFATRKSPKDAKKTDNNANPWDNCAAHLENIDLILTDIWETTGAQHSFAEQFEFEETSNDDFEQSLVQMEEFTDRWQRELSVLI